MKTRRVHSSALHTYLLLDIVADYFLFYKGGDFFFRWFSREYNRSSCDNRQIWDEGRREKKRITSYSFPLGLLLRFFFFWVKNFLQFPKTTKNYNFFFHMLMSTTDWFFSHPYQVPFFFSAPPLIVLSGGSFKSEKSFVAAEELLLLPPLLTLLLLETFESASLLRSDGGWREAGRGEGELPADGRGDLSAKRGRKKKKTKR